MAYLIAGYYVFNNILTIPSSITTEATNINFTSNDQEFTSLSIDIEGGIIEYGAFTAYDITSEEWLEENYKTIYISEVTEVSSNIYTFFELNASFGYTLTYNSLGGDINSTVSQIFYLPDLPTPTRDGFTFDGWYYDITFTNQAQSGDEMTGDVTLFAKWIFTGTIKVTFYNKTCEDMRVDKTNYLINENTVDGYLRNGGSLVNMVLVIEYNDVFNYNYCYINAFSRYYYIDDIINVNNKLWQLNLSCDVLMTYKDTIKQQTAYVTRQENVTNPDVIDDITSYEQEPIVLVQEVNTTPFETDVYNSPNCYIINVVRRDN